RHLLDAGRAPGRPEVDDHPLAALRGKVESCAVERRDRQRGPFGRARRGDGRVAGEGERERGKKRGEERRTSHGVSVCWAAGGRAGSGTGRDGGTIADGTSAGGKTAAIGTSSAAR